MTEELFNRGTNRERSIWDPFVYNGPFSTQMTADRSIIFGLYAACYTHGFNYLNDISAEDLLKLLDVYNANTSALDNEGQILVLEIAAKEYVKTIELQIKEMALKTKRKKIAADETATDIKIDALEADRAELTTKQIQIDMAIEDANLKIQELEQRIDLESINQQLIAVEITQKEIEALRTEQRILLAAQEALAIQLAIVEIGIEEARINVQVKENQADIARIHADIAARGLTEDELEIDQTELNTMEYLTTDVWAARQVLQQARKDTIGNVITDVDTHITEAVSLNTARLQEAIERIAARKAALDDTLNSTYMTQNIHQADDDTRETIASFDAASRREIAVKRTEIQTERRSNALWAAYSAIEAAKYLASADIVNTLTHQLGSG